MDQFEQNRPKKSNVALITVLIIALVILVGALMFLLGRNNSDENITPTLSNPNQANQQKSSESNSSQQSNPTPAPAPAPTPTPTPSGSGSGSPSTTVASFAGTWTGSYTPKASLSGSCVGGTVTVALDSKGDGLASVRPSGAPSVPGVGTVDKYGNFKGIIAGLSGTFTGKLSGNSGSGSYIQGFSCSGSFSLKR